MIPQVAAAGRVRYTRRVPPVALATSAREPRTSVGSPAKRTQQRSSVPPGRWVGSGWCLSSGPDLGGELAQTGPGALTEANLSQIAVVLEFRSDFVFVEPGPSPPRPGRLSAGK